MTQGRGYKVDAAIRVNGVGVRRLRDWQWLANIANIPLFGGRDEVRGNVDSWKGRHWNHRGRLPSCHRGSDLLSRQTLWKCLRRNDPHQYILMVFLHHSCILFSTEGTILAVVSSCIAAPLCTSKLVLGTISIMIVTIVLNECG